jgi:nucleotide-binding universal stress UspA family protein
VIAARADSLQADTIAVGSRGHGPIAGALIASVSQGLITRSHVPVTVVPRHVHDRLPA